MKRRDAIKRTALMMGYALSASAISGVMSGCKPEGVAVGDWKPVFFSAKQGNTVAEIAERILPATDTPGAKDVFVHEFIDLILADCYKAEEQEKFKKGLEKLNVDCQEAYGNSFLNCSRDQQLEILNQYDKEAKKIMDDGGEKPFFAMMKEMTLLGYFTSEKIGEEVLAYLPIPGEYQACIDYEEGTAAWSL